MKVLGIILMLVGTVAYSDGLITCVCVGTTCSSDTCLGELCFSKVLYPAGEGDQTKGCYFNSQAQNCNMSTALHTTVCCQGERCNEGLSPTLPPTQAPVPPTGSGTPSCYESDSSLVGSSVGTCPLESFCYSTLRRRSDGSVIHRRGCATTCLEETRNRKIKRCCNTSLCNSLIEDTLLSTTPTATPPTPPSTQSATPLATYSPPLLNTLPPTDPPPTATPTNRTLITCHCDGCQGGSTCTTDVACGSWFHSDDPLSQDILTVRTFCVSSMSNCGPVDGTTGRVECCFHDYCNNFEEPSTASTTVAERIGTTTEASSSTVATTTPTTRATATAMPMTEHDIYLLVGIGIFAVTGVLVIVIAIVATCYCWLSRRSSPRRKAKKATEASKARLELAVGTTLSFPSPNIYSSRRESSRESVSTDANSTSLSSSENVSRTPYSSTSV